MISPPISPSYSNVNEAFCFCKAVLRTFRSSRNISSNSSTDLSILSEKDLSDSSFPLLRLTLRERNTNGLSNTVRNFPNTSRINMYFQRIIPKKIVQIRLLRPPSRSNVRHCVSRLNSIRRNRKRIVHQYLSGALIKY